MKKASRVFRFSGKERLWRGIFIPGDGIESVTDTKKKLRRKERIKKQGHKERVTEKRIEQMKRWEETAEEEASCKESRESELMKIADGGE